MSISTWNLNMEPLFGRYQNAWIEKSITILSKSINQNWDLLVRNSDSTKANTPFQISLYSLPSLTARGRLVVYERCMQQKIQQKALLWFCSLSIMNWENLLYLEKKHIYYIYLIILIIFIIIIFNNFINLRKLVIHIPTTTTCHDIFSSLSHRSKWII